MNLTYAATCDCQEGKPLHGGEYPEYYDQELAALKAFVHHEVQGHKYFAVHLKGKHALSLEGVGK